MTIFLNGKKVSVNTLDSADEGALLCFMNLQESKEQMKKTGLDILREDEHLHNASTRFESHNGFEYISLNVPSFENIMADARRVEIYFAANRLYFICDDGLRAAHLLLHEIEVCEGKPMALERALLTFFVVLIRNDAEHLDDIEEEIALLEDALMDKAPDDSVERIGLLRKKLMVLKRYYEGLFDLLEDLEENWNHLFSKEILRAFRIQTNKADRLSRAVLNLRDYVTQVREAYQNQLDINLNQTMKLFTVITAVFMPLSLIAGWYGMNLYMPETQLPFMYPLVIIVSLLVAAGCLIYFKKKKWF